MATLSTAIGLDIGRYAVKALWARRSGGTVRIERTAKLRLPRGAGDIRPLLEPWLAQHGAGARPCALGLPGRSAMFQPFLLPPNDPRAPAQVADMEVIRFNEMASEAMAHGFAATETHPGERVLLLAVARSGTLTDRLDQAHALRLDVADMIPDPAALFPALRETARHAAPVLAIHIGQSGTDLAVFSASGLLFARSFAAGGQMFTEALADARNLSLGKAEDLKLAEGSLATDSPLAPPMAKACTAWIEELRACLSVYDGALTSPDLRPRSLALTGGGSQLPGLADTVAQQLGLPLAPPPAWSAAKGLEDAPAFAVAYGLACAALSDSADTISLLPAPVRDNRVFRAQKPYWIASGLAASLILAIGLVGGLRDIAKKNAYFNEQEASYRVRERIADQITAIRAEQDRLHAMTEPVVKFLRAGPQMRYLITLAANSLAPEDQIVMVCDAESFFSVGPAAQKPPPRRGLRDLRRRPAAKPTEPPDAPTFERVIIEGYTRTANLSTVRTLIGRLREAEFVESADLLGDDVLAIGQPAQIVQTHPSARHFVIEVKLTPL